jgi:hypothetical protein
MSTESKVETESDLILSKNLDMVDHSNDLDYVIETMEELLNKTESEFNEKQLSVTISALDLAESNTESLTVNNENSCSKNDVKSTSSLDKLVSPNSCQLNKSYEQEIDRLKELIKSKETDILNLDSKLNENEQQSKFKIEQLHLNFQQKLEQTLKKFQDMQKDKTSSMVMKYADAEKRCIDLNRSVDLANSKLNDAIKEKQRINERLEKSKIDYQKLNQEFESKIKEIMLLKQENNKIKEQAVIIDAREKAANLRLKTEVESSLNSKRLILQLNAEINELNKKIKEQNFNSENLTTSDTSIEPDLQVQQSESDADKTSESNEANTQAADQSSLSSSQTSLDQNQQQQQKKINLEREKTARELNALKSQLKDMFEERTTLRDRLQYMENERKLQEISLNKFKETIQNQKQMNKDLLNEILHLRELQETLTK